MSFRNWSRFGKAITITSALALTSISFLTYKLTYNHLLTLDTKDCENHARSVLAGSLLYGHATEVEGYGVTLSVTQKDHTRNQIVAQCQTRFEDYVGDSWYLLNREREVISERFNSIDTVAIDGEFHHYVGHTKGVLRDCTVHFTENPYKECTYFWQSR